MKSRSLRIRQNAEVLHLKSAATGRVGGMRLAPRRGRGQALLVVAELHFYIKPAVIYGTDPILILEQVLENNNVVFGIKILS